jgi:aminomethyltransferase
MLTCGSPCLAWLRKSALGFDNLDIRECTEDLAALSLQGPTSFAVLKAMGLEQVAELKPFGILRLPFGGTELMISRTGFTGDLGYELWIDPEYALPCGTRCMPPAPITASSPTANRRPTWRAWRRAS